MVSFSACLVFCAHILAVSGQCGFPGKPLNGKVFIEDSEQLGRNVFNSPEPTAAPQPVVSDRSVAFNSTEKYDHMRLTTKFTQEINESNWKTGKLYRVAYRCDVDLLVDKDGGNGHFRECVNGRWTGNIPQCVETTTILKVLHHLADSTLSYSIDEQGIFPECFTYSQNQPLIVQLPEMRRLSGIQISSETSGPDLIIFPKGNFSFKSDEQKIPYERKHTSNSSSLFVFTNLELSSMSIELLNPLGFCFRQLKLFAFPDKCGHPEIPLNGNVKWQRGTLSAEYFCKKGYELHSAETRTCEKGRWLGREPSCKIKEIEETGSTNQWNAITPKSGNIIIIMFDIPLTVISIAVLVVLAIVYLKKKNSIQFNFASLCGPL